MQKLERDSRIRGYLRMNTDKSSLAASLEMRQREEFELHAQSLSQLEVFAHEWKDAGARGLQTGRLGENQEKRALEYIAPKDSMLNNTNNESYNADKGAVLLGNLALSLYETRNEATFSLYKFTARYNNDVAGTYSAELPFIHADYPDTPLTSGEIRQIEKSFQLDPTGTHLITHPKLWPRDLLAAVLSPCLERERKDMQSQIQHYKHFAKGVIQKNPDAYKPYDAHPEQLLSPNVAADILQSLGDF